MLIISYLFLNRLLNFSFKCAYYPSHFGSNHQICNQLVKHVMKKVTRENKNVYELFHIKIKLLFKDFDLLSTVVEKIDLHTHPCFNTNVTLAIISVHYSYYALGLFSGNVNKLCFLITFQNWTQIHKKFSIVTLKSLNDKQQDVV